MIRLTVNGTVHELDVAADTPLLWVLRDFLKLTGTKYGCGAGQCGACTVHVGGQAVRACSLPVSAVGDAAVVTIEGVAGPLATALKDAWARIDVGQCGYCQPGQIMQALALLSETPQPTDAEIDRAMAGNLCRCATYQRIRAAIHAAALPQRG